MNAAYLLMTSAMMLGQAQVIQVNHKVVASSSSCGPTCSTCNVDPCCESLGDKLRGKLRGLFQRDCGCAVQSCDPCPPKLWKWDHCSTQACDPCAKPGLLSRLRGMFHRQDACCDGGTSTCASPGCASPGCASSESAAPHVIPAQPGVPVGEHAPIVNPAPGVNPAPAVVPVPAEPAKKMPAPPPAEKKAAPPAELKKVQAPVAPAIQGAPAALNIGNAPVIQAQPIRGVLNRDPF